MNNLKNSDPQNKNNGILQISVETEEVFFVGFGDYEEGIVNEMLKKDLTLEELKVLSKHHTLPKVKWEVFNNLKYRKSLKNINHDGFPEIREFSIKELIPYININYPSLPKSILLKSFNPKQNSINEFFSDFFKLVAQTNTLIEYIGFSECINYLNGLAVNINILNSGFIDFNELENITYELSNFLNLNNFSTLVNKFSFKIPEYYNEEINKYDLVSKLLTSELSQYIFVEYKQYYIFFHLDEISKIGSISAVFNKKDIKLKKALSQKIRLEIS